MATDIPYDSVCEVRFLLWKLFKFKKILADMQKDQDLCEKENIMELLMHIEELITTSLPIIFSSVVSFIFTSIINIPFSFIRERLGIVG